MKKLFLFMAMLISMVISIPASASDYDFDVDYDDGVILYYTILSETDLTVQVSKCSSSAHDVNIPPIVAYLDQVFTVISIGEKAFRSCHMSSVSIANTVRTIGKSAFEFCHKLTSVGIPNSVTTIGDGAFYGCNKLNSINIPESVTTIGNMAFYGCKQLTSVDIPESVTSIGYQVFYNSGLESVVLPASITSIGDEAFYGCGKLTSVTIPESVTTIGKSAFYGCEKLTKVHISDLAAWCNIDFQIQEDVDWPGEYEFEANPLYYGQNLYLNGDLVTDLVIPPTITEIKSFTFAYCACLNSMTIPDSVILIGDFAFHGCKFKDIWILNPVPPTCGSEVFSYKWFTCLHVPEGAKEVYATTNPWCYFQIVEDGTPDSGIVNIEMNTDRAILISTVEDKITIKDCGANEPVVVCDIVGNELYAGYTTADYFMIPVSLSKGNIYLVTISGRTIKYLF